MEKIETKEVIILIVVAILLFILSIIMGFSPLVLNVQANTVNPTYHNNGLDYVSGLKFYNWTSATEYNEVNGTYIGTERQENIYYDVYGNANINNFGSNGISMTAMLSNITLINNSYYSTTLYICYTSPVTINFREAYISDLYANSFNYKSKYSKEILSNTISNDSFEGQNPRNYCRAISFIYQPARDGNVLNIRLTSTGNLGAWHITGTQTEYIGDAQNLTENQLNNAIENSGLATASSINEVKSSVNQVKQEINEVNNTLTQDHNYNQNPSKDTSKEKEEMDNFNEQEQGLLDNLDMSGVENLNISINANASNWIWEIVNQLRSMNQSIVLLITSALGLGIIKMILNR